MLVLATESIAGAWKCRRGLALRGRQENPTKGHQARQGIVVGMEAEANMSARTNATHRNLQGVVSHHDKEIAELAADRDLAVAYLKAAMQALDDPDERSGGLLALRTVAEAYGGLGMVAAEAGISRESLYRALSPKGNPTLKTLVAVLKTVGLRLSVEPAHPHAAQ
jgi:probable addiction module antidote protein